jgi:hypothetical protein
MRAGERIDLIRTFEDEPGHYHLGTVELLRGFDEELADKIIEDAWPLFQFGPDEADFEDAGEYEKAVEQYGEGSPDSDSEFVAFLLKHHGDIFKEAPTNREITLGD